MTKKFCAFLKRLLIITKFKSSKNFPKIFLFDSFHYTKSFPKWTIFTYFLFEVLYVVLLQIEFAIAKINISTLPPLVIQKSSGHVLRHILVPELRQSRKQGPPCCPAGSQEGLSLLEELHPLELVVIAATTATGRRLILTNVTLESRLIRYGDSLNK